MRARLAGFLWEVAPGEERGGFTDGVACGEAAPLGCGESIGCAFESDLLIDLIGSARDEGPEQDGEDARGFDEVIEDFVEACGLGGIFC
ncbi:MAG: hypothetical protein RI897_2097 [Verrucomicrobiota bacterium]